MNTRLYRQLTGGLGLYVMTRILAAENLLPAVLRWHLADVLCLPLVLGLALLCHRLGRGDSRLVLPRFHGGLAWFCYAVYFEGILPHLHTTASADFVDVLCYLAGWGLFEWRLNRPGTDACFPKQSRRRPAPA